LSSKRSLKTHEKRSRISITLKRKLDVIKRYEEGQTTAMISRAVNLGDSTLRNIRDNAEKIKGSIKVGTPLSSHKSSYNRARIM
jgi:DNA invertase Pin-like site-specific DNA recombinase